MKKCLFLFFLITGFSTCCYSSFSDWFSDQTMRIDYFHTGKKGMEIFSLDQVYVQGIWAGSKTNLLDTLNLGKYQLRVYDKNTTQLIYSRGFSSIYGEWETTAQASVEYQTFHESGLIPCPKSPVFIKIAKRDEKGEFKNIWKSEPIQPKSRFINRETIPNDLKIRDLKISGPCSVKVDLLVLGDGYTPKEMKKFRKDAEFFMESLFRNKPFSGHQDDFNIRALEAPSVDSGIDEPRQNRWKNTPFGCTFNSLDLTRYVLSTENKSIRNLAAHAPYDFLVILFNSNRYGGGGIFNLYAISFSCAEKHKDRWLAEYVMVHEFGHSFGGLGDEYYSSTVAYEDFYPADVEPWEPNVTALHNPENLKWKALVEDSTPLPTPWPKAAFDSLTIEKRKYSDSTEIGKQKLDSLNQQIEQLLQNSPFYGKVGAFEGAGYSSTGLYRPFLDCRMFSKSLADFDPVCQAAIVRMIDFYAH